MPPLPRRGMPDLIKVLLILAVLLILIIVVVAVAR
jgi:hypothetical protein